MELTEEHRRLIQEQIRAAYDKGYEHGSGDGRAELGSQSHVASLAAIERGNYLFSELYKQLAASAPAAESFGCLNISDNGKTLTSVPDERFWKDDCRIPDGTYRIVSADKAAVPIDAEGLHVECKRVTHNAIHDAIHKIDDCEPVKDAVRDALDSIDLSEYVVARASEGTFEKSFNRAVARPVIAQKHMSPAQRDAFDAEWQAWQEANPKQQESAAN